MPDIKENSVKTVDMEKFRVVMDKNDQGIPYDLSATGGALYVAIVKRIMDDSWDDNFNTVVREIRTEMENNLGAVDEEKCLCEMAAAQISGPAIEQGYEKTGVVIDRAGEILGVDAQKSVESKYLEKGRLLVEHFKKYPKKILIAAIAGGILFCGPSSVPLMGPKPADASSLLGIAATILVRTVISGADVNYSNGNLSATIDGDYIKRKVITQVLDATVNGLGDSLENGAETIGTKAEIESNSKKILKFVANNRYKFNEKEKKAALRTLWVAQNIGSVSMEESVLLTLYQAPWLSKEVAGRIVDFVAACSVEGPKKVSSYTYGKASYLATEAALKALDSSYDRDEETAAFVASAAKIGNKIAETEGITPKMRRAAAQLSPRIREFADSYYTNPAADRLLAKTSGELTVAQTGELASENLIDSIGQDQMEDMADTENKDKTQNDEEYAM